MLPVASHDDRQLLCHVIVVVSYVLLMEMLVMNNVISVENDAYSAQKKLCALKFSMFDSWELKKCIEGCIKQDWIEKVSIECQAKYFSFLGQNSNYFNLAQMARKLFFLEKLIPYHFPSKSFTKTCLEDFDWQK